MRQLLSRVWLLGSVLLAACVGGSPPPPTPTVVASFPPVGPTAAPAAAPGPAPTAASGMRFRVAATQPATFAAHLLPYWVGIEAQLFQQQGLIVELVTLQSDQLALTSAANGDVDLVIGTPAPPLLAVLASGLDLVMVGATHNAFDQHLLAAADIATPADLVGKATTISEKWTLNDWQTREAIARVGLDPDSDLGGTWTGSNQAERVNNLRLGNGQAIVMPPPLSVLLAREGFTDFGDLADGAPWPGAAIIVSRRTYSTRFDYVQRFLRGLLASIQRTKADPDFARQVLVRNTRIDDPEAIAETYAVYGDRLLERVPYLSMDGLQRAIEFAATGRPNTRRLQAAALVDHTILQRLESSGHVDSLYR